MCVEILKPMYGDRIIGPTIGGIPKIRLQYIHQVIIKIESDPGIVRALKHKLMEMQEHIKRQKGFSQIRINIDVDPN